MSFRGVHRLAESLHERLIEATFGLEDRVRFLLRRVPVSVLRDRIFSGAPLYPVPDEVHAVESAPREAFRLVPLLAFEDVVRKQALPALHSHRWVAPNHPGKPVQSFGYPPAAPARVPLASLLPSKIAVASGPRVGSVINVEAVSPG